MRILVAGDIHGKLDQLRKIAEALEPEAVLQVGDMGFFVDEASMDRPGRRHIEENPLEGEIFSYVTKEKEFPRPLYFVRGNHEDYNLLERFEELGIRNMYYLRSGIHTVLSLSVGAIGGCYFLGSNPNKKKSPKYTKDDEVDFLFQSERVDVMLSHDGPTEANVTRRGLSAGSPLVSLALESLSPRFAFHGHHTLDAEPYDLFGTRVFPMTVIPAVADAKGLARVSEALFGLLHIEGAELAFHYLRAEELPL